MSGLVPKKLTGWLILLIVLIGPLQISGALRSIKAISDTFQPLVGRFPSLSTAILVSQWLVGASVAVWAYTAWILYRRIPGTLRMAQSTFLCGAALRVMSGFSIALLGGLPSASAYSMVAEILPSMVVLGVMITIWYGYLIASPRVREIYAS